MSEKDIGLLNRLIERLLFSSKIARPDVLAYVSYTITKMELPKNHHQDGHLNVDVLFVKKIRLCILSSVENRHMEFESLFSKHTMYLLNIIQQIIQSRRFKAMLTILKVVSKNTNEWICMNLGTTQANYTTNSLVHATTDARIMNDKPSNQGVKTANDQCHNTHQESILSNTVTESDIYNHYSYTSRINWEIEKIPETYSKKIEFIINKPEIGLKKIDFNIINNNNEIDDMNDDEKVHPSDDQADNMYNNIDHQTAQQKQTNHNSLYTIANNEIQSSSDLEDQNEAVGWKSTNGHKGELVVAYDNRIENKTLRPRVFYALYVRPNNDDNRHLIYRLSTDQKLVTKEYQSVPVPEDLIEAISKTDSYGNKNQVNRFDNNHSIVQNYHPNNNNDYGCIHSNDHPLHAI
mmetsp:Transcript_55032/g.61536  ORF Transcript_55032/g.61536 Transcript_55032/m.61536 type:complete len:406 (+) Transcript_55032:52-1269(+)